jgi:hypothetical protein
LQGFTLAQKLTSSCCAIAHSFLVHYRKTNR